MPPRERTWCCAIALSACAAAQPPPEPASFAALNTEVALEKVVRAHLGDAKRCTEEQLAREPEQGGQLLLEWTATASGGVSRARVSEATAPFPLLDQCLLGVVQGWSFPKSTGDVEMSQVIAFEARPASTPSPAPVAAPAPEPSASKNPTPVITHPGSEKQLDGIQRGIDVHMAKVQQCYETALAQDVSTAGKLVFAWTIARDGSVKKARLVSASSHALARVGECVLESLKTWRFARLKRGTVQVSYPFEFSTQGL